MLGGDAKSDLAGCSFSSSSCILQHWLKDSEGLNDLITGLFSTNAKREAPFYCCSNNIDHFEHEFSRVGDRGVNRNAEAFVRSARQGIASISEELEAFIRDSERLPYSHRSSTNIERADAPEEHSIVQEMQVAAIDFAQKKLERAINRLRRLIGDCDPLSSRLPTLRHALAIALMESGNLPQARRELLQALSHVRFAPPQALTSDILDDLGMVYIYQGKLEASLRTHRRALSRNIFLRDQRRVARSCEHLGLVRWKQGDSTAALGWLLISLSLRCPLGFAADLADSMDSLGRICSAMKFYSIGLELHHQAFKHRSNRDEPALAKTLTNLGVMFRKLEALSIALTFHQRAMRIRMYYQDKIGIANSYNNQGLVLMKMGRLKSARKQVRKAFRLRHEMGDALNLSRNLSNLRNIETALRAKARRLRNLK
jgi:tetratricopeptide (TPR) repeat protein